MTKPDDEPSQVASGTVDAAVPVKVSGNTAKLDAIIIKALERDARAVRMRVDGKTYEVIAKVLHYGHRGNAVRAVKRRLKKMREECAADLEELRFIESQRLDLALAAIMPKVRRGDLPAIDRLLKIQERRAAFKGLDQPKGLRVEVARELEGFIERLRAEFDDDVYERLLAIFAGELGAPEARGYSLGEGEVEGEASGGGIEGSPPAAPGE
jgi:hypothetical protein